MTKYSRLVLVNDTKDDWNVKNTTGESSNGTINVLNIDNTDFETLEANTRHLYSSSADAAMLIFGTTGNSISINPSAIAVVYLSQTLKTFGTITVKEASTIEDTTDAYLAEQYAGFVLKCIGNDDSGMITNLANVNHRTIIDYGGSELIYDGISDTQFPAEYKGGSGTIIITSTDVTLEPLITTVPLPRIIMDLNGHVDVTACDNTSDPTTITYDTTNGVTDITFTDNTGNAGSIIATNCPNLTNITISAVDNYSTTSVYLDNCPLVTGLSISGSGTRIFKSVGDLTLKNCKGLTVIFASNTFYTTKQCNIVVDNCPSLTSIGSIQGTPVTTGTGVTSGGLGANIEVSNCPLLTTIGNHQPGQSDYVVNTTNDGVISISEYNSVCYADGYYVAVGNDSGLGMYVIGTMNSDDTINWYWKRNTGTINLFECNSVCYGNGYFVAIGSFDSTGIYIIGTMNSNATISWSSEIKIPGTTSLNSVCYANGYFIAVGSLTAESGKTGICAVGTVNGKTIDWTVTKIYGIESIESVCYGNGYFVAVGNNGESGAIGLYAIGSIDIAGHMIWNETSMSAASDKLISVCFANGYFVAISAQKYYTGIVSANGTVKWSMGTELQKGNTYNSICYGNGYFVISGSSDSMLGTISADGEITLKSVDSISGNEACYGNGHFVTVGAGVYGTIQLQTQALTGTINSEDIGVALTSICYANGYFVAVNIYNAYAIGTVNADGSMSWKSGTISGISSLNSVCYGEGYFVAICSSSGTDNYTIGTVNADGSMTWKLGTISGNNNLKSVCYGNGYFVAVSYDSDNYIIGTVNADGSMSWKPVQIEDISSLGKVCYGEGYFVAVSYISDNYIISTVNADGSMSWKSGQIGINNLTSICYGEGYFVAVRSSSNEYAIGTINSDGSMTWKLGTISGINNLTSICYGEGYFVAVSSNSENVYAIGTMNSDGTMTWTTGTISDIKTLYTVCNGNNYFVAGNSNGDYVTIQLQDTNVSVNTTIDNCSKITDLGASNSPPSTSYLGYYIDSYQQSFGVLDIAVKDNYIFAIINSALFFGPDIHHLTSTGQIATNIATSIPGYIVISDGTDYYYASFSNGILGAFIKLTGIAGSLYEGCNTVYTISADNKTIYVIGIGTNGKPAKLYGLASASGLSSGTLILSGKICTYKNKIYNIETSGTGISIYTLNAGNELDFTPIESLNLDGTINYASASSEYLVVCTSSNLYVFPITDSGISGTSLLSLSGNYMSALYLRNHKFIAFTDSTVMVVDATSSALTATNQMSFDTPLSDLCRYGEFGVIGYAATNIYTFTVKGAVNRPVIRITGTNPEYKQLAIKSWAGESMFGQTEPVDLQYSRIRSGTGIDVQSTYYTDNDGLLNLQSVIYSTSDDAIIALIEALDANAKIQFHPNNRITFTAKNNYGEFIGCTLTEGTLTITNGRFIYNNIQYYSDDELTISNFSIQSKYPISITGNGKIDQSWFTSPITLRTNGKIADSLIGLEQNQYVDENNNLFINTTASQIIYSSSIIKEPVTEPVTDTFVVNPIPSRNLETPPIMQAM